MPSVEPRAGERARAAFVAAAVGDALGWPMEDRANRVGGTAKVEPEPRLVPWRRREGGGYGGHEQRIPAGAYSDDTQLLLAVARSRLRGEDWYRHLTEAELPVWLLYERGGGGALKRSARCWSHGRPPWDLEQKQEAVARYFGAGGNGAAMRCAPHVLVDGGADSFATVRESLDADALATHGHPRALVGSRVFAWALRWALGRDKGLGYGELLDRAIEAAPEWAPPPSPPPDWLEAQAKAAPGWEAAWSGAVDEALRYLGIAREGIAHGAIANDAKALERIGLYGEERGAGTVTAAATLFLAARYTSQPQQGLLSAAFLRNTDSDTVAAMTGALLGGLAGGEWLGDLPRELQDARYLHAVATAMGGEGMPPSDSLRWEMPMRTSLYRRLDASRPGERLELPLFGEAEVRYVEDHETRGPSFVRSWELDTAIGQSIAIKRYDRGKEGKPRWRPLPPPASAEPSQRPPQRKKRPVGLVRQVADLETACRFYEDVVGLERERATDSFVSFGWLALELEEGRGPATRLPIPGDTDELEGSRQAIRVYLDGDALLDRHGQLQRGGLHVGPVSESNGTARFRCADPDGYVVEFRARNGG